MIRNIATVTVITLALSQIAHADDVIPSARVTSSVIVRRQPDTSSDEVGRLRPGDRAALIQNIPRWREIRLSDNQTGFVSKSWTEVVGSSTTLAARTQNELRVHFLNTGSGTCVVVECPGADAVPMIIDCGSSKRTDTEMTAEQSRDYIAAIVGTNKPNLVLSHGDLDHYSLIPLVLANIDVDHVWQGGAPDSYSEAGFPDWLTAQTAGGATLHAGLDADWHNGGDAVADLRCGLASTYVLTVNAGSSKNANSLVLAIEYQEFTAIFTGDAEGTTETRARENFSNAVKATVLAGSHHGASTRSSNSARWAQATDPDIVVYTAGDQYGHPRCQAVERYTPNASTQYHDFRCGTSNTSYNDSPTTRAEYVTHSNGTIVITSDGSSIPTVHCTQSDTCGLR